MNFRLLTLFLCNCCWMTVFAQVNPPNIVWSQKGHGELVRAVRFSPQGSRIVSGGGDRFHTYGSVVSWEPATGTMLSEVWRNGDYDLMHVFALDFLDDETRVLTAEGGREGGGGTWTAFPSRLLDTVTGEAAYVVGVQGSTQFDMDVSPNGSLAAYAQQSDPTVEIKDTTTGLTVTELPIGSDGAAAVEFSPSGEYLAVLQNYGLLTVFRLSDGAVVAALQNNESIGQANWFVLSGGSVTWSPDGGQLAVALSGYGCGVKVWDFAKQRLVHSIKLNYYWGGALDYTPDGKRIVVGSSEWDYANTFGVLGTSHVRLIDVATGQVTATYDVPTNGSNDGVLDVDVSPDGTRFVYGTAAGFVTLANLPTVRNPKLRGSGIGR